MTPIEKLAQLFAEFPGIGERQSKRFAYFILAKNGEYSTQLIDAIKNAKNSISQCSSCYRYFESKNNNICDICSNSTNDKSVVMVVEKDADLDSVRRSREYKGLFFILGGLVPIVEKTTLKKTRINELLNRIQSNAKDNILKEVILAFSLSKDGDHTDSYIRELLHPLVEKYNFKVYSLGRGLSTGTELEYSDGETIRNALKNKR